MAKKNKVQFLPIIWIVISLAVIFGLVKAVTFLFSNAAAPTATISFSPAIPTFQTVNTQQSVTVNVNTGTSSVGFIKLTVLFDKTKLALTGEVTPTNTLKTIVSQTTMSEANATGQIEVSLGLATGDRANAPKGVIPAMVIPFKSLSTRDNDSSTLSIDEANTQIVDQTPQNYTLSVVTSSVVFNPKATPTATVVATASPLPSPTVSSSPIATATTLPTPTATSTTRPSAPVSSTPLATRSPIPTPGTTTTKQVTWTIETGTSGVANIENSQIRQNNIYIGNRTIGQNVLGLRFRGTALPANVKVVSATFSLAPSVDQQRRVSVKVGAIKGDLSAMTQVSDLKYTQLISYTDNIKWLANTFYNYDVTIPVREIAEGSQSHIVLAAVGTGNPGDYKFIQTSGSYAPKLTITYEIATPSTNTSLFDWIRRFFGR